MSKYEGYTEARKNATMKYLKESRDKLTLNLRFVGNVEEPVAEEVLKELRYIRFPAFYMAFKEIHYFLIIILYFVKKCCKILGI